MTEQVYCCAYGRMAGTHAEASLDCSTCPAPANDDERLKRPSADFLAALEASLPNLRRFARRLCGEAELAEDLVQSTCMRACAAFQRFQADAPMTPWLYGILRNEFYQHGRKQSRTQSWDTNILSECLLMSDGGDWCADLSKAMEAIHALPAMQRDAVILVLVAELTYEEAGAVLGCKAGTVKSRVSRGRQAVITDLRSGRFAMAEAGRGDPPVR